MPGWDAQKGKSGDTWLPGGFLAPSSWRHHSSARNVMRMLARSEEVNKSYVLNFKETLWIQHESAFKMSFIRVQHSLSCVVLQLCH